MFRSYCITVRPKNGLHGSYAEAIEKYIRKQTYYVYNYEKTDEARHIHAQIWFEEAVRKTNIQTALKRIAEKQDPDWGPASRKVLVSGVKIGYSDAFFEEYIQKDGQVQMENWNPPTDTDQYYPTEEEQSKAQAKANCKDSYFFHLKELWHENNPGYDLHQFTNVDIAEFYYQQMFQAKTIAVIRDAKQRKQISKALNHYIYPYEFAWKEMVLSDKDIELYQLLTK